MPDQLERLEGLARGAIETDGPITEEAALVSSSATSEVVPLLLADAAFRAELEKLVWEARRAEAVFVCHDDDVVGAWERLADHLDLVQRAYVLWMARSRHRGLRLGQG